MMKMTLRELRRTTLDYGSKEGFDSREYLPDPGSCLGVLHRKKDTRARKHRERQTSAGDMRVLVVVVLACAIFAIRAEPEEKLSPEEAVLKGNEAMKIPNYKQAVHYFNLAVAGDPQNAKLYFKRAEANYLNKNRNLAYGDVEMAISLNPGMTSAHKLAGRISQNRGQWQHAIEHYEAFLRDKAGNKEVTKKLTECREGLQLSNSLDANKAAGNLEGVLHTLNALIPLAPDTMDFRIQKIEVLLQMGLIHDAISECNHVLKLEKKNLRVLVLAAEAYWKLGTYDFAQNYLKQCAKYDPDYRDCAVLMKKIKKIERHLKNGKEAFSQNNFESALDHFAKLEELEPNHPEILDIRMYKCRAYQNMKKWDDCIAACGALFEEKGESDIDSLLHRAECHLGKRDHEEAIKDFRKAQGMNPQDRRVMDGLHRAENIKKQAERKDYYEILGVARDASQRDIKSAFRKQSMKWHPDKFSDPKEKEEAEGKYRDILEAYDILESDETRDRYDRGEDIDGSQPNPGEQQGGFPGGGFPGGFHGGGFPGGGGGGRTFTFNFGGGGGGFPGGGFPGGGGGFRHP